MGVADPFRVEIRVVPRASRDGVEGLRDGRILVRVTAPPVDGAATAAAVSVLAQVLDVAPTTIRVVAGETSRNKAVTIRGLRRADVLSRLAIGPDSAGGPTESHQTSPRSTGSRRQKNR